MELRSETIVTEESSQFPRTRIKDDLASSVSSGDFFEDGQVSDDDSKNLPGSPSLFSKNSFSDCSIRNGLAERSSDDSSSDSEDSKSRSSITPKDWIAKYKSTKSSFSSESGVKLASSELDKEKTLDISNHADADPFVRQNEVNVSPESTLKVGPATALLISSREVKLESECGPSKPALSFKERYQQKMRQNQRVSPVNSLPSPADSLNLSNLTLTTSNHRHLIQTKVLLPVEVKFSNEKNILAQSIKVQKQDQSKVNIVQSDKVSPEDSIPVSAKLNFVEKPNDFIATCFVKCIQNLTTHDMATKDWTLVKQNVRRSLSTLVHDSPHMADEIEFESICAQYWTIWKYLQDCVRPFEEAFTLSICFVDQEFEENVVKFRKFALKQIPEKLQPMLMAKIEQFIVEYRLRNKKIQQLEHEFVQLMLGQAGSYYSYEMSMILGPDYCDSKTMLEWHNKLYEETRLSFLEACSFKNPLWTIKYEQLLQDEIVKIQKVLMSKNDDKRIVLEGEIMKIMEEAKQIYQNWFYDFERRPLLNKFQKMEKLARESAETTFDKGTKHLAQEIVAPLKCQLTAHLDSLYNNKRKQYITIAAKEKEIEIQRQSKESIIKNKQHQESQLLSDWSLAMSTPLTGGLENSLKGLEQTSIAIHVGLYTTKMGYISTEGKFHVLASVQNCVNFDRQRMVFDAHEEIIRNNRSKMQSFDGDLMKNDVDHSYWVNGIEQEGKKRDIVFRIEDLMSFILATLKWEAELTIKRKIVDCLIVVPQSLNDIQRKAVQDAAILAGFCQVDLINDTTAMAFSYVMETCTSPRKMITTNLHEGFFDAATFRVTKGSIECVAISGDFFIDKNPWILMDLITFGLTRFVRDTKESLSSVAEKMFTMQELNVEDDTLTVLSVPDEYFHKVQFKAPKYGEKIKVDSNYALLGASTLLRIGTFGSDNKTYQRWLTLTGCEEQFNSFKNKLLVSRPSDQYYKKSKNKDKGRNLSQKMLQTRQKDYFLKFERALHEDKLEVIKILVNLENQITSLCCTESTKMNILRQINEILHKIRDPNITSDEIESSRDNSEHLYRQLSKNSFEVK